MAGRIRLARAQELARLPEIERRAGAVLQGHPAQAVFATHGLDAEALRAGLTREQLWVALDEDERCVGYLLGGRLDDGFRVQQMDVDPCYGRRGHGRALLRHARAATTAARLPRCAVECAVLRQRRLRRTAACTMGAATARDLATGSCARLPDVPAGGDALSAAIALSLAAGSPLLSSPRPPHS
ncbi:GNAT family N-acetyltransferase [Xanthomonas sacchari]|uniref:GNAT family N-acetyltransferase n=1 Tax=Xanthomonas sacchari TaxID=56458 RepID=UPI003D18DD07